jgi:DNA-directed RNA polymerase specialized sigma24 family protein
MHVHAGNSPLAIFLAACAGVALVANAAKPLWQFIRCAFESYQQLSERLGPFSVRKQTNPPSRRITGRIRRKSLHNRALPPELGGDGCDFACCTSGEFGSFYKQTQAAVNAAIRHIRGPDTPAGRVGERIDKIYRDIHRIWLLEYGDRNEAQRRAALWNQVIADTLRYRRCRQKIAVILSRHLNVPAVRQIRAEHPNRLSVKQADNLMSEVISDVIGQLSPKQCSVFIYRLFTKVPEKEIARHLKLTAGQMEAYSAKSTGLLKEQLVETTIAYPMLIDVFREALEKEGIKI